MIFYFIQVSGVLAGMYLVYAIFFSHLTFHFVNRWYLIIAILLSFVLPFISNFIEVSPMSVGTLTLAPIDFNAAVTITAHIENKVSIPILSILYWSGVVWMTMRLLLNLGIVAKRIYASKLTLMNGHKVYVNDKLQTTFTFLGRIYTGSQAMPYDVQTVLRHEEVHIRQWHVIDLILVEISHILLWFNPILIWLKKSIQLIHEYEADDIMCKSVSKYTYCTLLLQASNPYDSLILTNSFFNSQIKKRLQMMTQKHSSWMSLLRYAIVIPLVGSFVLIFSCKDIDEPFSEVNTKEEAQIEISDVKEKVDVMPLFPNSTDPTTSQQAQFRFIFENLKYPEEARKAEVEGMVVVEFVITKEGTMDNIKIIKDIGYGCGDAVLEVMHKMNAMPTKWTPGKNNDGPPVNTLLKLPVRFKLK
ncbi:MAG: M56 family metallopeptidase [Saprospiraceae bacterium]